MSDRELLMRTLGRLSLEATPPQVDALLELTRELTFWAPQLGLSTLRDENVVLIRHVLDSLLLTPLVEPPSTLLDIRHRSRPPGRSPRHRMAAMPSGGDG